MFWGGRINMDNKKGQLNLGIILVSFIAIIVGVVLFQAIAQEAGSATGLTSLTDYSLGTQTNATTYYIDNYRDLGTYTIYGNGTVAPVALTAGNYTVVENIVNPTTGALAVSILPASEYTATVWQINATDVQASTYVSDSAARSIVGLIAIFFALAIAIIALEPTLRSGVLNMIGGKN